MVHKSAFLSLSISYHNEPMVQLKVTHKTITNDIAYKALMIQFTLKAP